MLSRACQEALLAMSALTLRMSARVLNLNPRRYVLLIGGPLPRISRLSSTRSVKSLPKFMRVSSHDVGRQFALMLPMYRLSRCPSFSSHEYAGVHAR